MVTTMSSSSIRSSTPSSPGSWVMTVRRSSANLSRIAVISVAITARSLAGSARIDSQLGDRLAQLGHLLFELGAPQAGEPAQRHVQDVVGLLLAEGEGCGHEGRPGRRTVVGAPDGGDDRVEHVDGPQQPLDDVRPGLRLAQPELATPGDHLDLVGHVVGEHLGQVEGPGHPVDQGQGVHPEAGLQRGVLVELVQHHVGVGVALQADDQAVLAAGRVVLGVGDPVEVARPSPGRGSSARPPRPRSGRGTR